MPKEIEKNDIDISTLFKWKTEYTIIDNNNQDVTKVFLRLVGDAELNRSRVYALRKSSELRKKLHDPNSDENIAYIPDIEFIDISNLVEGIILQWTRQYAQEAVKNIKMNLPTEPDSSATLEQQEEYQKQVDEWPNKRETVIREYIEKKMEEKRNEVKILPKEVLYNEYFKLLVNNICEDEMLRTYRDMCTYFGLYKDENCTEKLFQSFEEFNNLSSSIKAQLLGAYMSLEIDGEDLKKLQEVTQ
jgi:hypothetical protein